jgi:hypothetical protein
VSEVHLLILRLVRPPARNKIENVGHVFQSRLSHP